MKIWKATLSLSYDDNMDLATRFSFKPQEKDYRINENHREWVHSENWVWRRIPMDMTIEKTGQDTITIVQGFDYQLADTDLINVEAEMRKLIKEQLDYELSIYKEEYLRKINTVCSGWLL